jgi:ABC-2 type transport system ATP-binding protein
VLLEIHGLTKRYPTGVQALSDVSLTIPAGMFGLLGRNGAGKSTLMRILATLQEADSGEARLGALDVLRDKDGVRRVLGYLPQEFGLYPKVSALQLLDHFARLKGIGPASRRAAVVEGLLRRTNLWDARKRPVGGFSGGMKQRFGIAQALLGEPRLLIVDEPTAGLDPEERVRFHDLLAEIGESVVVILSTHIVGDVMDLCRRMAVLHAGRVILQGAPVELAAALRGKLWRATVPRERVAELKARLLVVSTRLRYGEQVVHVHADARPDEAFEPVEPELEDAYFWAIRQHEQAAQAGASA